MDRDAYPQLVSDGLIVERAKNLTIGTVLYHRHYTNADGTPQRWRVNGKPKVWKRSPERVQVPLKRGLWEFGYINEVDLDDFALTEEEAMR